MPCFGDIAAVHSLDSEAIDWMVEFPVVELGPASSMPRWSCVNDTRGFDEAGDE